MAKDIQDGLNDYVTAQDSIFIDSLPLANAGDLTSDVKVIGQTNGGVQVSLVAESSATLTGSVELSVQVSDSENGTFTEVGHSVVTAGKEVFSGRVIAGVIIPTTVNDALYTKAVVTTSADDSGVKVSVVASLVA